MPRSVLEAIQEQQLRGASLKCSRVVVAEDLEELVAEALRALPSNQQVRLRDSREIPVCWAELTDAPHTHAHDEDQVPVTVRRTFIHVPDSSLVEGGAAKASKSW